MRAFCPKAGAVALALALGLSTGCALQGDGDVAADMAEDTMSDLAAAPAPQADAETDGASGEQATRRSRQRSLSAAYQGWKRDNGYADDSRSLAIALGWSRGLSAERSYAKGIALIDDAGQVTIEVDDPSGELGEVFLVDNQAGEGRSVMPEVGDDIIALGELLPAEGEGDLLRLEDQLDAERLAEFRVDLVVITKRGGDPTEAGILYGVPNLFQRLATGGSDRQQRGPGQGMAPADEPSEEMIIQALVDEGERLFVQETFDGNGRTCATCHPPSNNFTIDPVFISQLPPTHPLFVAEFNPDLAENFENPVLMRQFGLIIANADGFDDLANKFTMRSVPHTFAQAVSIVPSAIDGSTQPPFERTGWSGDGAPGGGTLREFSIGAVTQHAPLTLARTVGVDFRLPTDDELDAMEAYMLSLGRQADFDLSTITFLDPRAAAGLVAFNGPGKCNGCHANAGANIAFGPNPGIENANFDTGVEDAPHPADLTGELRPRDGGFGQDANANGGFGDGRFNTSSLIEAADTPPFFHNNLVPTLEAAVGFYNTPAFNNSPSGQVIGGIALTPPEVGEISAMLRVLNSVDNIDRAIEKLQRLAAGQPVLGPGVLCGDIDDTVEVLAQGQLHLDAQGHLAIARGLCRQLERPRPGPRGPLINGAIAQLETAQGLMVSFP